MPSSIDSLPLNTSGTWAPQLVYRASLFSYILTIDVLAMGCEVWYAVDKQRFTTMWAPHARSLPSLESFYMRGT